MFETVINGKYYKTSCISEDQLISYENGVISGDVRFIEDVNNIKSLYYAWEVDRKILKKNMVRWIKVKNVFINRKEE
jgi:hypothetical protein